MPMLKSDAIKIVSQYAGQKGVAINTEQELGGGTDGWVFESYRPSAVKILERKVNYNVELNCYQRFAQNRLNSIRGFRVPQLIDFNDQLQVVEMTIVTKPFLIDFAKSHLDHDDPQFSAEQMAYWNEEGVEIFGAARWKEAKVVVAALKRFGIYYYDVKPGNLMFADWPTD